MEGGVRFFYRLDLVRRICFFISIPIFLVCLFGRGIGLLLYPLTALSVIGIVFGAVPFYVPTQDTLAKHLRGVHTEYAEKAMRAMGCTADSCVVLEGFSEEKAYLCRSAGVITVCPVCRTAVVCEDRGALLFSLRDTPLFSRYAPREWEMRVAHGSISLEKDKKLARLSIAAEGETLSLLIPNRQRLDDMLLTFPQYLIEE